MPTISVIVPVYNVEKYIERCVDSILNQTFTDFELILVDDGSPDSCGKICDGYAASDERIIALHQANSGASAARNYGISVSKGEYIAFIDSDDYVDSDYLEDLYENRSDFTMCGFKGVKENRNGSCEIKYDNISVSEKDNIDIIMLITSTNGAIFSPYCKLFRADLIRKYKIRYPSGITWGEDGMFVVDYLTHINSMKMIDSTGYFYVRYNENNSLSTKVREDIIDMIVVSREYCANRIVSICSEEQKKPIDEYFKSNIRKNCYYFIIKLLQTQTLDFQTKCDMLKKFMQNHYVIEAMKDDSFRWPKEMKLAFRCKTAEQILKKYIIYSKRKGNRIFRYYLKHFV